MSGSKKKTLLEKVNIDKIVHNTREALGKDMTLLADSVGLNLEHFIRFTPIAKTCEALRKHKRMTIHQVANKLKVPQYKIKDIEGTNVPDISVSVLRKYVEYLGLKESFETWETNNPEVLKNFKP